VIERPDSIRNEKAPVGDRGRRDSSGATSGVPPDSPIHDPALSTPGFRRLTRDSLVYGLGTLSGKAMGLLLLPVLARALSRDDYGLLDVLWSLGTGIAGILLFGLDAAAVRLYFDETLRDRASLLATWGVMLAATAGSAALVLVFAASGIAQWAYGPNGDPSAPLVLALIVPATLTNYFAVTVLRTAGRPVAYAAVSITTFVLYGGTVIALALGGRASVVTTMGAWGISLALASVLGLALLRSTLVGRVRRHTATRLLRYGLPLAPVLALTLASDFVHRAILLSAGGAAEVAHLTVALRFASLEALLISAFQLAWQPRVFSMGTTDFALHRIATDARRFLGLAAAASLALALVMPAVVPIVAGEPYRVAVATVGWCLSAALLAAAYAMAATPSAIAKRPGDITRSTVAGISMAVVANIVLAPRLGSIGTGVALVIGQAVAILVVFLSSRRALSLPGPWLKSALVVVTTSIASIAWTATNLPLWIYLASVAFAGLALLADATLRDILKLVFVRWSSAPRASNDRHDHA
jgi:O-antigen/teichoic acid export membrane protein